MAANEIQEGGLYFEHGIGRSLTVRPYSISGLPLGIGQDKAAAFAGLPELGDPDPLLPEAICISRRIVRMVKFVDTQDGETGTTALARAIFSSNNPYSGGPRPITRLSVDDARFVEIPSYTRKALGGDLVSWDYNPLKASRPRTIRVEVRFVSDNINDIQLAIEGSIGRYFEFVEDRPMQFIGGRAATSGTGQNVVAYNFDSNASINAVPAQTHPGQDIDIPECPPLHEYHTYLDASGDPVIEIVPGTSLIQMGDLSDLPGLA